eukprot:10630035-Lingulodinium_polyedra.AAC.1
MCAVMGVARGMNLENWFQQCLYSGPCRQNSGFPSLSFVSEQRLAGGTLDFHLPALRVRNHAS